MARRGAMARITVHYQNRLVLTCAAKKAESKMATCATKKADAKMATSMHASSGGRGGAGRNEDAAGNGRRGTCKLPHKAVQG